MRPRCVLGSLELPGIGLAADRDEAGAILGLVAAEEDRARVLPVVHEEPAGVVDERADVVAVGRAVHREAVGEAEILPLEVEDLGAMGEPADHRAIGPHPVIDVLDGELVQAILGDVGAGAVVAGLHRPPDRANGELLDCVLLAELHHLHQARFTVHHTILHHDAEANAEAEAVQVLDGAREIGVPLLVVGGVDAPVVVGVDADGGDGDRGQTQVIPLAQVCLAELAARVARRGQAPDRERIGLEVLEREGVRERLLEEPEVRRDLLWVEGGLPLAREQEGRGVPLQREVGRLTQVALVDVNVRSRDWVNTGHARHAERAAGVAGLSTDHDTKRVDASHHCLLGVFCECKKIVVTSAPQILQSSYGKETTLKTSDSTTT